MFAGAAGTAAGAGAATDAAGFCGAASDAGCCGATAGAGAAAGGYMDVNGGGAGSADNEFTDHYDFMEPSDPLSDI